MGAVLLLVGVGIAIGIGALVWVTLDLRRTNMVTVPVPIVVNTASPAYDAALDAVRAAFADCGLPLDAFSPSYDLARAGKLNDVLHHASLRLGQAHPLSTVADVVRLLSA